MQYKVVINATNKLAPLIQVLAGTTATPGGYTSLGTFEHPGLDTEGPEVSHVIFQHVQELMYLSDPDNIQLQNLQFTHITWPGKVVATAVALADQSLTAGTTKQLTPVFTPTDISRKRVRWSTTNDKVAAISPQGLLIARAPGVTKGRVEVVDGGVYKEFVINSFGLYVQPTSVTIAPVTPSKIVGQTQQFTPTVVPANSSNKAVNWTSSDPTKATINSSGLATAVAAGTTTITATTVDGAKVGTTVLTVTAS